jgi:mRNA-degrading endonuclease toxin of MazEF toxin-antitoxin module
MVRPMSRAERVERRRAKLRAAGLQPVQIWVPDTRSPFCRSTSHLVEAPLLRIGIGPESGLERPSQIQIDKAQTPRREGIGPVIGRADDATLVAVNRALAVFLGLV